ncbi:MAG: translation initiation factor IF-2 [Candidatus Tantalella remota]|nr:translation initiation factor IF-2 [Candidatus Tantalella remota]
MKVKDLAKELGVPSEAVIEQLRKLYVDVEDEKSKIDDKILGLVRIKLRGSATPKKPKKEEKKPKKAKAVKKTVETKAKPKTTKKKDKPEKEESQKNPVKKKEAKAKEEKKKTPEAEEKEPKKRPAAPSAGKINIVKKVTPEEKKAEEDKAKEKVEKEKAEIKKAEKEKKAQLSIEELVKTELTGRGGPGGPAKRGPKTGFVKRGKQTLKKRPIVEIVDGGSGKSTAQFKKFDKFSKKKQGAAGGALFGEDQAAARKTPQKIQMQVPTNIRTMAPRINVKPNVILQYMMDSGAFVNINQDIEEDVVRDILKNFGYILELPESIESIEQELVKEHHEESKGKGETRAPVVTFMGHVDHGKTSLLDYIRNTMVTEGEKGGITQHIGAYKVETSKGSVTFLDTPGHAAFTAMRARGAHATDVVVLVVAADDGVMPQTKEAIDHARAAGVPIVVAINKCDMVSANPDKVKQELQQEQLAPEEWGGDTIMVEVSAQTGEGVDKLVEILMLESEMLDLKANPNLHARGVVIEGKKTPGQGVVATLLVQNGTLRPGDVVLCGTFYGKVKAMLNDVRERVEEAPPSTPVEVLGLQGVPEAGDEFFIVKDEKKAKTLSLLKQGEGRKNNMAGSQRVTLEDFHSLIMEGTMKELKIILKADVQGSAEALKQSLEDLSTSEVKLDILHSAVGNVNESDVMLAVVSNAVIIGFHVKTETTAEDLAKSEQVDMRIYDIIYEAIADVKAAMEGLLEPEEREAFQGTAQIKEVFSSSKAGKVAGCAVTKGIIHRNDRVRLKRGTETVFDGTISALKRFKDDVRDVREGFECGILLKNFSDIRKNDIIEAYIIEKIARRLEK